MNKQMLFKSAGFVEIITQKTKAKLKNSPIMYFMPGICMR